MNSTETTHELVQQVKDLLFHMRGLGLKPVIAVLQPDVGHELDSGFMCLYCAETRADVSNKQVMPLIPYFYPHAVARELVRGGVIEEVNETRRTGISVIWCAETEQSSSRK